MRTHDETKQVLDFWFGATPGSRRAEWFAKNEPFDAQIRARFLALWERAARGELGHWMDAPRDCLALIVLTDQFPRNMFRGQARAFSSDAIALAAARRLLEGGADRHLLPVQRQFAYLPFEHSEALADQHLAVALLSALDGLPEMDEPGLWARKHLEIIERFGRFPHRNAALGRVSTPEEELFLTQPGSSF